MNRNWTIKDIRIANIRIANVAQPSGVAPEVESTSYHSPRLKRTIMGGPGNRSSIIDCSCAARFDGVYERRMCDWYARHAGITGGGEAVEKVLRQYDAARDVVDYPDHPRTAFLPRGDPEAVLDVLRTEINV